MTGELSTDAELSEIVRLEAREIRNPLRAELESHARVVTFNDMRRLAAVGAPAAMLFGEGLIAFTDVEVDRRDVWQPRDHGARCVIVLAEEQGAAVDLIAFGLSAPDTWFVRTGATWALGMDAILDASRSWGDDVRLVLHATPLDWLRARCVGACVTLWNDEAKRTLCHLPSIDVRSPAMASALRAQLSRPLSLPSIQVQRGARHAA